jgi:hypothetical protein
MVIRVTLKKCVYFLPICLGSPASCELSTLSVVFLYVEYCNVGFELDHAAVVRQKDQFS